MTTTPTAKTRARKPAADRPDAGGEPAVRTAVPGAAPDGDAGAPDPRDAELAALRAQLAHRDEENADLRAALDAEAENAAARAALPADAAPEDDVEPHTVGSVVAYTYDDPYADRPGTTTTSYGLVVDSDDGGASLVFFGPATGRIPHGQLKRVTE